MGRAGQGVRGAPSVHRAAFPGDACLGAQEAAPGLGRQSWAHLEDQGRASQEEASRQALQGQGGRPEAFPGRRVRRREGTASPLEGRADQMSLGD